MQEWGSEEAAMDLSFSAEEEQFRAELRDWLEANIPESWTRPGFWVGLDPDQSFRLRRGWGRDKAQGGFSRLPKPPGEGGGGGPPAQKAGYHGGEGRGRAPPNAHR